MLNVTISFSGGTDCLFLTWMLLQSPKYAVHLVRFMPENYLDFANGEIIRKTDREQIAVTDRILPWLANNMPQSFTFEYVDYLGDYDANYRMIHALEIVPYSAHRRASGRHKVDAVFVGQSADNTGINGRQARAAQQRLSAIHDIPVQYPLLESNLGRAHALAAMHPYLKTNNTSCINLDSHGYSCGKCYMCQLMRVMQDDLDAGKTASEITAEYHAYREKLRSNPATNRDGGWFDTDHPKYGTGYGPPAYSVLYPEYAPLFIE